MQEPTPTITDLVETQEDTCTSANWMSYFSYKQQKQGDAPYLNSDSDEFDDDVSSKATKAFTLRKPYKGAIGLTISSPYIREHLLRAIGIEFYNGVAIGASHTVLNWPFSPLYHHLGDIRANVHNDHNATKTERNNIGKCLTYPPEKLIYLLYPSQLFIYLPYPFGNK